MCHYAWVYVCKPGVVGTALRVLPEAATMYAEPGCVCSGGEKERGEDLHALPDSRDVP